MGKAPQPTPPKETSAAATGTNISTAIANAFLGNMNETTPDGTRTFSEAGRTSITDPYTGETYEIPRFSVETTLSPEQQRIKAEQDAASLNLSTLAKDQSGFLGDYMAEPFSYDPGEHEGWALDIYDRLGADSKSADQQALASRLANQGIGIGTEAYDRAMGGLYEGQQRARDQFLLDSYKTGFGTAQAQRNQPINEITALLSGGQVSNPMFSTSPMAAQAPTTDNAAIINSYDNQKMNAWMQNQAAMGSAISGLGGLFSLSDERAKTDKERIGTTEDGLGLYKFRYKGSPKVEVGLMAQDVKKKKPKAVRTGPDGLMRVNYREALK